MNTRVLLEVHQPVRYLQVADVEDRPVVLNAAEYSPCGSTTMGPLGALSQMRWSISAALVDCRCRSTGSAKCASRHRRRCRRGCRWSGRLCRSARCDRPSIDLPRSRSSPDRPSRRELRGDAAAKPGSSGEFFLASPEVDAENPSEPPVCRWLRTLARPAVGSDSTWLPTLPGEAIDGSHRPCTRSAAAGRARFRARAGNFEHDADRRPVVDLASWRVHGSPPSRQLIRRIEGLKLLSAFRSCNIARLFLSTRRKWG